MVGAGAGAGVQQHSPQYSRPLEERLARFPGWEGERTALRPGLGHLTPIKFHVHAEISVKQDQEMADRIERAGTHGVTHDYLGHR